MPNANTSRPQRINALRNTAIFAVALAAGVFMVSAGRVPCAFARMFHVPCPGCGSTRAMLALAHGDLHGFIHFNPLAPLMTLIVLVLIVQAFGSMLTTGTFARVGQGIVGTFLSRAAMVVATFEVLLWIARFAGFLGGPVPV